MTRLAAIAVALSCASCTDEPVDPRPSILLVVFDTLRADAVSAYGRVEGTTPHFDALAKEGVQYTRAYSPSPWTLPSHASLFTGLRVDEHGVGIRGRMGLPKDLLTIAERLADAGYETAGFSENPLVGHPFAMDQGFSRFSAVTIRDVVIESWSPGATSFDVVGEVERFFDRRDTGRPFFVFVNLFGPHNPYENRDINRFLPPDVDVGETWTQPRLARSAYLICDKLPPRYDVDRLWGLYLGDVSASDAKLGGIVAAARQAAAPGRLITVATADHGELFGEQRMLDHEFSVRAPVLHIPLVVHGAPGAASARVETPVELADVTASVLSWAGTEVPVELDGRPLPTSPSPAEAGRELVAIYSDAKHELPEDWDPKLASADEGAPDRKRAGCGPTDRVFGSMLSWIRWPHKLIWYERYPPELYDLSWDPDERTELTGRLPDVQARLLAEAEAFVESSGLASRPAPGEVPSRAELEALRGLGYLEPGSDQ